MSISPSLQSSARAAYRQVLRSCHSVFKGDPQAISVSHSKLRSAYEEHRVETDPKVFEERVNTAKEVATLIRKHIVQGEMRQEEKVFDLKITPDTELGDNASIRKPRTEKTSFPNRGRAKTAAPAAAAEPKASSP